MHIEDCIYPHVTTWIRAFQNAKMAIVDSFHGMVFSVIFNVPFWVIGNEKRGLSRFYSFLKLLELEHRIINPNDLIQIDLNESINWENTNKLLEKNRIESLSFLYKNIN